MHKEILVIDDNPDIRFLICNILEEQKFKVRTAANYDQAVVEINKNTNRKRTIFLDHSYLVLLGLNFVIKKIFNFLFNSLNRI